MGKKEGENTLGPSYTTLTPVYRENKSLKRETKALAGDGGSGAVRPQQVSKGSRKTGKL